MVGCYPSLKGKNRCPCHTIHCTFIPIILAILTSFDPTIKSNHFVRNLFKMWPCCGNTLWWGTVRPDPKYYVDTGQLYPYDRRLDDTVQPGHQNWTMSLGQCWFSVQTMSYQPKRLSPFNFYHTPTFLASLHLAGVVARVERVIEGSSRRTVHRVGNPTLVNAQGLARVELFAVARVGHDRYLNSWSQTDSFVGKLASENS